MKGKTKAQAWTPEPWTHDKDGIMRSAAGRIIFQLDLWGPEFEPDARRIVACVNALAGIEDPSAVKELIEAVREHMECNNLYPGDRLHSALAKLARPTHGG